MRERLGNAMGTLATTKPELEDWFERQIQEFSLKENRSERMSTKDWKNEYIFTEVHEIFFVSSAHELQEWLARL